MQYPTRIDLLSAKRAPLATCIAVAFALATPVASYASSWLVNSCADNGSNTLRDVVTNFAQSGDTVDLSQCSVISLTTGAIAISQKTLTLQAPATRVAITGYNYSTYSLENDRILKHTGSGTLTLRYLDVRDGSLAPASGLANGGCIYSSGNVILEHTRVSKCAAKTTGGLVAYGGGIYAKGSLTAKYDSVISGNTVSGGAGGSGGGAAVHGAFGAISSTISGNHAMSLAGGVVAGHGASVAYSTISGNTASRFGGLIAYGKGSTDTLLISDSTISGNVAQNGIVGGVSSNLPTTVRNSTIAFNTATTANTAAAGFGTYYAPGLTIYSNGTSGPSIAINLQSVLISNNTYGVTPLEMDFSTAVVPGGQAITISSVNSLIRASSGQQPATVSTACPLLGPLRDNGGPTLTHALLSGSPAIGTGNNNATLTSDQRGPGYARRSGTMPDIGAYEVQQGDVIFNAGFDGCPILF